MGKQVDILQGTLDMLILKAVSLGPLHGYGILLRIQQVSKDALQVPQGSLYPALYRLEHRGWIAAEWGESKNKRKAKYYRLTAAGRKQLRTERREWKRLAVAIADVLAAEPEEGGHAGASEIVVAGAGRAGPPVGGEGADRGVAPVGRDGFGDGQPHGAFRGGPGGTRGGTRRGTPQGTHRIRQYRRGR